MRLITLRMRFPLRHPFYPDWMVTPVRSAHGRCTVLSGTFWELVDAAAAGISAEYAVFALQYPDNPFLSDADRDVLWETFEVPVYTLLLDGEGRLVGYECEAQDGLHIPTACANGEDSLLTHEDSVLGFQVPLNGAVVESTPCDCGRPGVRLRFPAERLLARRLELVPSIAEMSDDLKTRVG